ncbi:MAG: hypothetical protein ACFN9G_01850 [Cardiobacterium sp.]
MRSRNIEHLTALQQARTRQEEAAREREAAPWWLHELGSSIWTGLRRGLNNIDIQQADAAQKSLDAMEATEGKARELRQQGTPDLLGQNIGADPFELTSAAGTWNPDELYRKKHTALERARDRNLAEYEEDLPDLAPTRAAQTQREMEDYMAKEGMRESLGYIITHPRMATNMAMESLGQFAPTLVATGVATALGGPVAGAATIGAGSADMEYTSTVADRISASAAQEHKSRADVLADRQLMNDIRHEARTRAAVIATIEALTFGLTGPIFHAVRARVPGWKGTLAAWGAGTGVQASGGAAGEAGAQLATKGEITSWPAVVAEFYLEILQGAPEILTHAKFGKQVLQEEQRQNSENLNGLRDNVQNSKLGQRDPEALRDYLDEVLEQGGMQDLYLDGEVLHQNNLAELLADAIPEQAQEIRDAVESGGQVQVKTRDILTRVQDNPELAAAIEPHIRHAADAYSQAELDSTAEEEIKADLARDVAERTADEAHQAEVDAVRDDFAAQLDSIGRFTPEVNKIYGTLVATSYDALAQKLGISLQEAVALRPLNIVGAPVSGLNQEVWHGTPYFGIENEGFRLNAIGTGEGAQAYGWGIYFAGDREISEAYRSKLSEPESVVTFPFGDDEKYISTNSGWRSEEHGWELEGVEALAADILENEDIAELRANLAAALAEEDGIAVAGSDYDVAEVQEALELIDSGAIEIETRNGQLYSADIPENDVLLDYDAPLSEQPEAVKAALEKAFAEQGKEETFAEMKEEDARGEDFYNALAEPQEASETLLKHGITGLRYLDGNSRADGEGNHNFVIWDEDLLTPDAAQIEAYYQSAPADPGNTTSPVARLTGEEIATDLNPDNVVEATRDWFKANLQGKVFHRKGVGDIRITGGSWKKKLRFNLKRDLLKARLIPAIPDVLQHGHYYGREELAKVRDDNIVAFHYFGANVEVGGNVVEVSVSVAEDQFGKLFYNINPNPREWTTKKLPLLPGEKDQGAGASTDSTSSGKNTDVSEDLAEKITESNDGVNINYTNNDTLQQNKGTPRGSFDPATNTIALLEKADLSTFIHELGHFFFESNIAIANQLIARDNAAGGGTLTDGEKQLINDVNALLSQANLDLDTWNIMTLDQRRSHHETVARQFEAYMMEGKAPVPELQGLFARARAWLFQLYKNLTALNVNLTDDVRQVFDRMIAGEAAINQARQMRLGVEMLLDADLAGMTADEFKQFQQQFQDATNLALDEMQLRQLADAKAIARLKHKALKAKNKEAKAARGLMEMDARRIIYSQPVYRAWQLLTAKMTPDTTIASNKRPWTDSVEPAHDDLFTAIAKLGGINRQEIESTWGFDPADKISPVKPGFFVLRKTGGETIDGMKRLLEQYGYLTGQDTLNDFYDLFMEQHRGNTQYSNRHIPDTSSGKAGEGANLQNLPAFRLDYRSLEDMGYSADQINSLGKKVQKTGGIHPDLLAELILDDAGNAVYGSGDELVLDLMTVPDPKTAVRDLADQLMQQQYGELATPQAIAEAADLAIHNDITLRLLATEYNALAKASGKPTVVSRAARQLARDVIGRTRIRDLNPAKYTRMEGKAAKRAFDAAKKGDVALAAAEKRSQLLQAAHAREALEARAEIKNMINYLRRADNLNPKSIDPGYREQIEALLDGYSLRQRSGKALDRRQSLADWVQDQRNQGFEPDIPERLLDDLNRKPWQELTVDELRGLADTVKQIEHIGKTKQELLTARKNKNAKKRIANMAQAVEDNAPWADRDNRTPVSATGRARVWAKGFAADHRRVAMLTRQMDGNTDGGIITDTLVRPANVAGDTESAMTAHAIDYFRQHVVPAYNRKSAQRRAYPLGGKNVSLSDREIFTMLLNWGNEGNRQRLLGGEGWQAADFEPLLTKLTAAELDAVQAIWDYFETFRPEIAAKEQRVNGVEPQWVAPTPFSVVSADGQTVNLRGGYYPIRYDLQASERAAADDAATQAQAQLRGVHSATTTRRGHTKSRVKEVHDRPLAYTFAGIYSGFSDIIHDLSWHEYLIDTNKLLRSSRIRHAIKNHYGTDYLRQLQGWVQDIAVGDNQTLTAGEEALRTVRRFASMAGLGFNAVSALKQPLGLLQSVARVGGSDIFTVTAQFIAHPARLTREAKAASAFMQNRSRTRFRELNELRNALEQLGKTRQFIARYSYALIMAVQQQVDVITWHAQLNKTLRTGATVADAVAQADQAVIDSQGSGLNKDLSAVERGGEWRRLFTVYYSYMNAVLNLEINALTSKRSLGYKAGTVLMLSALMPILDAALNSLLKPGDDDKWDRENLPETLGKAVFNGLTGHFFALRELQWSGYGGYSGPTGLRGIKDAYNLIDQTAQGELDDGLRRALINTAGSWFGLPSAQINRSWDGLEALAADETDNPLALAFGYQ